MLNENLAAKQREREARKEIHDKAELLRLPPEPRAASITAAVMADRNFGTASAPAVSVR
jgi:hypothetical protein